MKILLIHPPDRSYPSAPFAGIPTLAPSPKKDGHEVVTRDMNLELFLHMSREDILLPLYDRTEERMRELGEQASLTAEQADEYRQLVQLMSIPRESLENVTWARGVMKHSEKFYNPKLFNKAFDDLRAAQRFYFGSNPIDSAEIPGIPELLQEKLAESLNDPVSNALRDTLVDSLLAEQPDLIGVSLPFMMGYWDAMKLIKLIKDKAPDMPIVLGGALVQDHEHFMCDPASVYDLYDYVCRGDGDAMLGKLATALETGGDLQTVPNLYYRESGVVRKTFDEPFNDLNSLSAPDFSGYRMDEYMTPVPGAAFQTSRGCYYGKCTFCSENFWENFRLRKPEKIVEDMIEIYQNSGVRHFYLWDSLCPPKTLTYVAKEIKKRDLGFTWFAETKMEKVYLPPSFMQTLYDGGCRFLSFGFESASQRVLDLIDKDNYLPEVEQILRNMHDAGVMSALTWFIGFPTETEGEGVLTFDYLESLGPLVSLSSYSGIYNLLPDQPLFHQQEKFGIKIYQNQWGGYEYTLADGTKPYDHSELHEAYAPRGDTQLLTHGAYLMYSEKYPERFEQITGVGRVGVLARHVPDLKTISVQTTDATVIQPLPRDTAQDFTQPAKPFKMVYHRITGSTFRLRGRELSTLQLAQEPITTGDLRQHLEIDWPEMGDILIRLSNRGLLKLLVDQPVIDIDSQVAEYAGSTHLC